MNELTKERELNIRQHKFALFIYQGHTQREAWELAGYSTNYADKIIDQNACRLANTSRIKARLAYLIEAGMDSPTIATVQERKSILTKIARNGEPKHQIPAISEHNKMDGLNVINPIHNDIKLVVVYDDKSNKPDDRVIDPAQINAQISTTEVVEGEYSEVDDD